MISPFTSLSGYIPIIRTFNDRETWCKNWKALVFLVYSKVYYHLIYIFLITFWRSEIRIIIKNYSRLIFSCTFRSIIYEMTFYVIHEYFDMINSDHLVIKIYIFFNEKSIVHVILKTDWKPYYHFSKSLIRRNEDL